MRKHMFIWKRRVSSMPKVLIEARREVFEKDDLGDGSFIVLRRINDNACVLDMPQEYGGSTIFYIANFMDDPNLRTNSFQEGEFDVNLRRQDEQEKNIKPKETKDKVEGSVPALKGPTTRGRLKKIQEEELKVEQILNCFNLHGRKVVRLITLEFGDYVLVWWTQFLDDLKRCGVRDPCKD
ncbi:hypothetical protein CR513_28167, partial [Mucuna pruriens]